MEFSKVLCSGQSAMTLELEVACQYFYIYLELKIIIVQRFKNTTRSFSFIFGVFNIKSFSQQAK